jgi:hypothetical protein
MKQETKKQTTKRGMYNVRFRIFDGRILLGIIHQVKCIKHCNSSTSLRSSMVLHQEEIS